MTKKKVATKVKNDEVTCHTCKGKGTLPCGWMTLNMFVSDYGQWQDRPFYDLKKGMQFTLNGVKDPKGYYHKEYITVWNGHRGRLPLDRGRGRARNASTEDAEGPRRVRGRAPDSPGRSFRGRGGPDAMKIDNNIRRLVAACGIGWSAVDLLPSRRFTWMDGIVVALAVAVWVMSFFIKEKT